MLWGVVGEGGVAALVPTSNTAPLRLPSFDSHPPLLSQLYYVDNDATRLHDNLFSVGSGSTYAYGVLDTFYRPDLTVDEAIDLGKRAIYHATHRDAYSGGINNLYHVKADGWTKIHAIDVNELHYEFRDEKNEMVA